MILLDTNILIFAHNVDSPCHSQARELIFKAMDSQFKTIHFKHYKEIKAINPFLKIP